MVDPVSITALVMCAKMVSVGTGLVIAHHQLTYDDSAELEDFDNNDMRLKAQEAPAYIAAPAA